MGGGAHPFHYGPPITKPASKQWLAGHYLQHSRPSQWTVGQLPTRAMREYGATRNEDPNMPISDRQMLDSLSRMPFVDAMELAGILGEPHTTVHRALASLLTNCTAGRVSHGTVQLPSSQRYYLTAQGISEATGILGFETPSDFVRAYPVSREWLTLLVRRMDAVAAVYRLAATLSPGIDGLRSHVEFHRRGRFDATITVHDDRSFGVVRQGLALRRRSLYDRLRAIAEYDYTRRPDTILILVPSVWEHRLTTRLCSDLGIDDCFIATETREALERSNAPVWRWVSWAFASPYRTLEAVSSQGGPGGALHTESPERKRASIPHPERMVRAAATFGVSPSEKRTLDIVTDHPMIPREHLAFWLGVSGGRVSQMMRSLVDTWGLVEQRGKRGDTRYTLSGEGIRYITHRDRAQLPTTRGIWSTALTTDHQGRRRHVGHRIDTWARQTGHADGITWFLSKLEAEARADPDSELLWSVPTARSGRAYNWGQSAIAPRRRGASAYRRPSRAVLPRVRASRPSPRGSYCPPESLHELLLVHSAGRRPTPVSRHTLRRGHRGGRSHVRAHGGQDEPDVAAHLRVLPTRPVHNRDTGKVMVSTVGAGIPTMGAVRAARLPVGLTLPPDASESCRGE